MNRNYNRWLTLTDFLYLSIFFYGLNSILSFKLSAVYILYFVITLSLILDWVSAFTMSVNAGNILLISDIITVSNYLCLYKAILAIDIAKLASYLRFFFHYAIVFFIYLAWNITVIKNNRATNKTKKFFITYTWLASICCIICFTFFVLIYTNVISSNMCSMSAYAICGAHFLILITWIIKTFSPSKKK